MAASVIIVLLALSTGNVCYGSTLVWNTPTTEADFGDCANASIAHGLAFITYNGMGSSTPPDHIGQHVCVEAGEGTYTVNQDWTVLSLHVTNGAALHVTGSLTVLEELHIGVYTGGEVTVDGNLHVRDIDIWQEGGSLDLTVGGDLKATCHSCWQTIRNKGDSHTYVNISGCLVLVAGDGKVRLGANDDPGVFSMVVEGNAHLSSYLSNVQFDDGFFHFKQSLQVCAAPNGKVEGNDDATVYVDKNFYYSGVNNWPGDLNDDSRVNGRAMDTATGAVFNSVGQSDVLHFDDLSLDILGTVDEPIDYTCSCFGPPCLCTLDNPDEDVDELEEIRDCIDDLKDDIEELNEELMKQKYKLALLRQLIRGHGGYHYW